MSETVSYQSIKLLVSSAMKTSSAYFQTGRPLRVLFLASSSFPKKLFLRAFLFGFVSTVFFVLLGVLCWTFEQAGPSPSLPVTVSVVHMLCPSSARVVSSMIELKNTSVVSFISINSDSIIWQSSETLCWFNISRTISTVPKGLAASYAFRSRVNFSSL